MTLPSPAPHTAQPPAGWYPNQFGQMQWWDGYAWGQIAAPAPSVPQGNGFAVTALVAAILVLPSALLAFFTNTAWPIYTIGLVPIVLAATFGILGILRANKNGVGKQLSTVALVFAALFAFFPVLRVFDSFI
ncbi:hypothetical protein ACFWHR_07795 [Leucobacter sp. NPDC058333]|uniref:hypothetical protein n=1 Tax=Leucobacter sp. NPDC058333 TaxID=3346450 RepID=UPI003661896F